MTAQSTVGSYHPRTLLSFPSSICVTLCHLWLVPLLFLQSCSPRAQQSLPPPASPALLSPTLRIEDWSFETHPGSLITTQHYRIYSTCPDADLVSRLPDFLERALTAYTTALGPLPSPQLHLDTFLLADRAEWEALTRQLMGEQAATYLKIERGGFASGGRAVLLPLGPRDTFAIAAHEGWHQYTQRTFKDPLPAWLDEGLAATFEGLTPDPTDPSRFLLAPAANPERLAQLRRAAARGQLLPLPQLCDTTPESLLQDPDSALTWYAQAWALALFLRESPRYAPSLHTLLADAAAGRLRVTLSRHSDSPSADRILRSRNGPELAVAYIADVSSLSHDFDTWVATLLRPAP
jgi:hypothetical protein